MFICKSFIKKPELKIDSLDTINEEWEKYFIEVSEKNISAPIVNKLNLNYLEGAIYLKYGNEVILGFQLWDYVDQLWAYVIQLIEEFILRDSSETFFPDQPARIKFQKISNECLNMIVEANTRSSWILPKQEFLTTLLNASEKFFQNITGILGLVNNPYTSELSKIRELKEKI
ncbi:hypothetical protein [Sporolactobacillus putidus]|uniref:Uncharacterized protein n=1 Tax=Sporolactobacillus putidus TaxID=492735 RepID=A0A917VXX4_9BACL|nr:hypothetical protein [Sporolactobacillus putidus]GGL43262.1 hypothetical protein GCM10007968_03960 [Sporolactobacillus putidus]